MLRAGARQGNPASLFVVLTANTSLPARLQAFAFGADECLAKPVAPAELAVRLRSMARLRLRGPRTPICFGVGFALDVAAYTGRHGNRPVPLTRSEFELLHCLLRHRSQVLDRKRLGAALSGGRGAGTSNAVDVHVMNLRRALAGFAPADVVETVRGSGYRVA